MSLLRVKVESLSKSYRVDHASQSVKEAVSKGALSLFRGKGAFEPSELLTIFKDVSFEARAGEAIALMGPNGSGKSTFLKILCRIAPPSSGSVRVFGKVAAMLEVGTGFHPELTGRENVFLAAAILGMGRDEIAQRFESIVEFSGVSRHLDTPVKHYSSGMYVRLAFSVAAHSRPDILVVDEVLAVGDEAFQEKCLARIVELRDAGTAILFVSHDRALVDAVATRRIDISTGREVDATPPKAAKED